MALSLKIVSCRSFQMNEFRESMNTSLMFFSEHLSVWWMIHDILRLLYHNIELIRYFVLASWCLSYLNQRCTNFFVACFLLTNSHTFLTLSFRYQGLRSVVWRNSTKSSAKIDLEGLWHDNFFFKVKILLRSIIINGFLFHSNSS